jgi:ribonuclease Z
MLRITFLGTSGSIPTLERGMPSIAVKYEKELMLWDCGEGTQRQLMKYKVGYGSINAIFISHPHLDHYLGMYGLLETLRLSSPSPRPVSIFLPRAVDVRDYGFADVKKLRSGKLYSPPGFTVSAFPVKHCRSSYGFVFQEDDKVKFHEKKAHSLGLKGDLFRKIQEKGKVKTSKGVIRLGDVSWVKKGRKIVYTGDTLPHSNIIEKAQGADLLIHEATFDPLLKDEAEERMHSTTVDAATAAKQAQVKRLVLTHISPRYSDVEALVRDARRIFYNTEVAYDGMAIDVTS